MRLGEKQQIFSRLINELEGYIFEQGYEIRGGERWRSKAAADAYAAQGIGIKNSAHRLKLAYDINLFDAEGNFLTSTADHRIFGEYWEGLGETHGVVTCWGGRFRRRDGNHYSIEHNGVR